MSPPTEPDRMTAIETWAWGRFGSNGVNSDVKRHSEQIRQLFAKQDALRSEIKDSLSGIYKLLALIAISLVVGVMGILGVLLGAVL